MSDTKAVRFQFVVDENSARSVHRVLDDLIKKANELGKAMGGAGGGILGGIRTGGGTPSAQSTLAGRGGVASKQGGGSITQVLTSNVDIFKKMANDGSAAMKVMGDAVQRGVNQQRGEINKLKESLDALVRTYEKVGGSASGAIGEKIQNKVLQIQSRIGAGQKQLGALRDIQGSGRELMPEIPWPGSGAAKEGLWSKLTRSRAMPGMGMVDSAMEGSSIGQLLGGMGITKGMVGGAGLAMVGAWGAKNIYKQLNEAPDQLLSSDSRQATMLAQRSLELRNGELRNKTAEQQIFLDTDKRKDYESLGSGWRRFGHSAGAFFSGEFADAFTGRAADQGVKARRNKQIEMERATDPLMDAVKGDAQNFRATLGSMRAMGVYAKKGLTGFEALASHRNAYSAFDDSEIAAAFQGISGAGTRGAAYGLQGSAMHATAAGIHGAAGSIGTMSKFGGGGAFANAMLQMAGGGKVDATTTGIMTQYIAQQQDRLGMNTGAGAGQFQGQGLMDMIARGTQGQGGRLIAEQNMRGVDYLQRAMTGQTSPYQQARNFMIAGEAAPGLNVYGQGFLSSKMSMTELADAAEGRGGGVSSIFKALGGNKAQAKEYFKGVTSSLLEGVTSEGMGGSDSGILMKAMAQSGMDPREFFKKGGYKKLKGESGKIMTQEQAIAAYGGALTASDADMDPAAALGMARAIAGVSEGPGKGKGKAGTGGIPETELASQQMKVLAEQARGAAGALTELTNAAKSNAAMAKFEMDHRAAGSKITEAERVAVGEAFARNPDLTAEQAEQYLSELRYKTEEAEKREGKLGPKGFQGRKQ